MGAREHKKRWPGKQANFAVAAGAARGEVGFNTQTNRNRGYQVVQLWFIVANVQHCTPNIFVHHHHVACVGTHACVRPLSYLVWSNNPGRHTRCSAAAGVVCLRQSAVRGARGAAGAGVAPALLCSAALPAAGSHPCLLLCMRMSAEPLGCRAGITNSGEGALDGEGLAMAAVCIWGLAAVVKAARAAGKLAVTAALPLSAASTCLAADRVAEAAALPLGEPKYFAIMGAMPANSVL